MTADCYPAPLDADLDPKAPIGDLMNLLPMLQVDFRLFVRGAAFQGGPVRFEVINDPESHTKLRWTLWWTDENGQRQGVTSTDFFRCLWQAAAVERKGAMRRTNRFLGKLVEVEDEDE